MSCMLRTLSQSLDKADEILYIFYDRHILHQLLVLNMIECASVPPQSEDAQQYIFHLSLSSSQSFD